VADTRIVLVRHGESLAQERRVVGGHGCAGLSALGVRQVEALRDRLLRTGELAGVTALYSSVMARAVQTAQIIAPALGDLEVEQDCDFCEGHPSAESDGMAWEEFDQRWPAPTEWSPDVAREPGGESYAQMRARVSARLDKVAERHRGETVVVVCHGGVVVHSMVRWLGIEPMGGTRAWLDPINSSLTEWRVAEHPIWRSEVELVRFNDHGHLRGDLLPRGRRAAVAERDVARTDG
jgi:2,3-bisphosphoglycerate-dependent phosphoglycerate mutase